MTDDHDNTVVDDRLGALYGRLIDAGDDLNEEIAFSAIRAAYMRGYLDGEAARKAQEKKAADADGKVAA